MTRINKQRHMHEHVKKNAKMQLKRGGHTRWQKAWKTERHKRQGKT